MRLTNLMYYNYAYSNEMVFNQSSQMYTNEYGSYYYSTANDKRYYNKT